VIPPPTRPELSLAPVAPDQMLRLAAFRAAYPHVRVAPISRRAWQALVPEPDDGETVITRRELRDLLDRLAEMLDEGGK
jgi:hypothetical protein